MGVGGNEIGLAATPADHLQNRRHNLKTGMNTAEHNLSNLENGVLPRWPYRSCTHLITEFKQRWARLVLGGVTQESTPGALVAWDCVGRGIPHGNACNGYNRTASLFQRIKTKKTKKNLTKIDIQISMSENQLLYI
jgi:hypothetical protein